LLPVAFKVRSVGEEREGEGERERGEKQILVLKQN
jgi:hypothetical protein